MQAADVEQFLRAHPGWLAARPDLYRHMEPPHRVHGERLADHMQAMLRAERARTAAALAAVPDRRAAASVAARVQDAVLALMRAGDMVECIEQEWPTLLGVDAARWVPAPQAGRAGAALARHDAIVRPADPAIQPLHGEAALLAQVEALVRVAPDGLLLLASRDGRGLDASAAGELAFLGRAIAARL